MGVEVTIRMELPADLAEHVRHETGEFGGFDSVEAYVSELIRRDMGAVDDAVVEAHRGELEKAFSAPEQAYVPFDSKEFLSDMKRKHG